MLDALLPVAFGNRIVVLRAVGPDHAIEIHAVITLAQIEAFESAAVRPHGAAGEVVADAVSSPAAPAPPVA